MIEQLELIGGTPVTVRKMPQEPIVRSAEIEGPYRWTLKRAWGSGPCILWCGLNPSLADGKKDDPTMLREIGFSYRWGFGSLVKVNMFPLITSKPAEMRRWLRKANREAKTDPGQVWPYCKTPLAALGNNNRIITGFLAEGMTCVAAWGNGAEPEEVEDFLNDVGFNYQNLEAVKIPVDWHCLGRNDNGSPKHTLARGPNYIPDDTKLQVWRKAS